MTAFKFFLLLSACLLAIASSPQARADVNYDGEMPPDAHHLKIGDLAPDFSLLGVDGKTYTLADFKDAKALMVVFLSNHCPYSHAAETRILPFAAAMRSRGLAVVAINPNSADALRIDELGFSKYTDSYADMQTYAREQKFTFPYLYDGAAQTAAKAYGCLATPDVFIFDQDRRLRYTGRFDNSRYPDPKTVTSADASNAVTAIFENRPVPVETTRVLGCSTKWLYKTSEVADFDAKWKAKPVSLEGITTNEIADLVRNNTQNFRLINVWATWCLPCVEEFPGLVSLSRRMSDRNFEFITISIDDAKDRPKVQKFLSAHHAATPDSVSRFLKKEGRASDNYLYTDQSADALAQALDPSWPGAVPYTIFIAPGGKVLFRNTGEFDPAKLQSIVIDHMGAYY
jgi:peroxiredoxin